LSDIKASFDFVGDFEEDDYKGLGGKNWKDLANKETDLEKKIQFLT
jgi:hypothetical protein